MGPPKSNPGSSAAAPSAGEPETQATYRVLPNAERRPSRIFHILQDILQPKSSGREVPHLQLSAQFNELLLNAKALDGRQIAPLINASVAVPERHHNIIGLCEFIKYQPVDHIEALWLAVEDMVKPEGPSEPRHLALQFMADLICGQYNRLGVLRTVFYDALAKCRKWDDFPYVIRGLWQLTKDGRDLYACDRDLIPLLLWWVDFAGQKIKSNKSASSLAGDASHTPTKTSGTPRPTKGVRKVSGAKGTGSTGDVSPKKPTDPQVSPGQSASSFFSTTLSSLFSGTSAGEGAGKAKKSSSAPTSETPESSSNPPELDQFLRLDIAPQDLLTLVLRYIRSILSIHFAQLQEIHLVQLIDYFYQNFCFDVSADLYLELVYIIESIILYGQVPKPSLPTFFRLLCLLVNVRHPEVHEKLSKDILSQFVRTHYHRLAIKELVQVLGDPKSRTNVRLCHGALYLLGRWVWNSSETEQAEPFYTMLLHLAANLLKTKANEPPLSPLLVYDIMGHLDCFTTYCVDNIFGGTEKQRALDFVFRITTLEWEAALAALQVYVDEWVIPHSTLYAQTSTLALSPTCQKLSPVIPSRDNEDELNGERPGTAGSPIPGETTKLSRPMTAAPPHGPSKGMRTPGMNKSASPSPSRVPSSGHDNGKGSSGPSRKSEAPWSPTLPPSLQPGDLVLLTQERFYRVVLFMIELANRLPQYFPCRSLMQFLDHYCRNAFVPDEMLLRILDFYDLKGELLPLRPQWLTHLRALVIGSTWVVGSQISAETAASSGAKRRRHCPACPGTSKISVIQDSSDIGPLLEQVTPCFRPDLVRHRMMELLVDACNRSKDLCLNELCPILIPYLKLWIPLECNPAILVRLIHLLLDMALSVEGEAPYFRQLVHILLTMAYSPQTGSTAGGKSLAALGEELVTPEESSRGRHGGPRVRTTGIGRRGDAGMRRTSLQGQRYPAGHGGPSDAQDLYGKHQHRHNQHPIARASSSNGSNMVGGGSHSPSSPGTAGTGISHRSRRSMKNVMRTPLSGGRFDTLSELLTDNSEHAQFLTGQGLLPLQLVAYPFTLGDLRVLPPVAIRAYAAAYGLAHLLRHYLVSIRAAYPAQIARYLFRKALALVNERTQVRLETRFTLLQVLLALRANDEYRVYFHFPRVVGKDVAFPGLTCRTDRHHEDQLDWDIYGVSNATTSDGKGRTPDGAPGLLTDEPTISHGRDSKSDGGSLTRRLSSRNTLGLKKLPGSTASLSGETLGKSSSPSRPSVGHPRSSAQDGSTVMTPPTPGDDEHPSPGLLASSLVPSPFLFSYLPPTGACGSTDSPELSPGLPVPLKRETLGLKRYLRMLIRLLRQETSWAILRLMLVYLPDQLNCTALFHGQVHGIRYLVDKLVRVVQDYPMPVECVDQDAKVQVISAQMLHEQTTTWVRRMANAREYKRVPLDASFDASRSLLATMYQTQVVTPTEGIYPSSTKDKVTSWRHSGEAMDRAVEQANLAVYYHAYAILPHLLYSYRGVLDKRHFTSLTACFIKGLHHLLDDRVIMVCMHALQLSCYEIPQEMTRELPRILTALNQVITMGALDVYILEFLSALARLPKLRVNLVPENYKCIFTIALKYIKSSNEANTGWKLADEDGDEDAPKATVSRGAIHALSQYVLTLAYQVIDVWFMATKLADRRQYVEMIVRGLKLANRNPTELDEATEMCIDMLLRYAYSNVSLKPTQSKEIVQLLLMGPQFLMQRAQQLEVDLYQELQGADIQQLTSNGSGPSAKDATPTAQPSSPAQSRSSFKTILVRTPESSYVEERTWVQGHGIITIATSKFTPWSNVTIRRPSGVVSLLVHLNNELKVFLETASDSSVGLTEGGVPPASSRLEVPGSSNVDVASLLLTHWKMNSNQVDRYLQSLTSYCGPQSVNATVPTNPLAPSVESGGPLMMGEPSESNTTPLSPSTLAEPTKKFTTKDPSPRRSRVKGRSLSISKSTMDWLRSSSGDTKELVSSSYTPSFQPPSSLAPVPEIDTGVQSHPSMGNLQTDYTSGEGAALLHRSKSDPQPPLVRRRRSTISEVLRHHATGQTAQGGSPDRSDRESRLSPSPLDELNQMAKSELHLSGYVRDVLSRFGSPLPVLTSPGTAHTSIAQRLKGTSAVDTTGSFMTPPETLFNPFFLYGQFSNYPEISRIEPLRPVPDDETFKRHLRSLDHVAVIDFHKIGIIYVGPGKTQEVEILQTTQCPSGFWRFLSNIGTLFSLRDCKDIYIGGLDKDFGTDGEYSVYWKEDITQVAFHVTPLMPTNLQHDPQCNLKKRHVGNDYVRIIYNESGQAYRFDTIRCDFNFVNIVIEPLTHNKPHGEVESLLPTRGDGDEHLSQPLSTVGPTPTEAKRNSVDLLTSTSDTSTSGEDDNGWSPYDRVTGTIGMEGSLSSVPQYRVYLQRHPDMPQFSPITEPKIMSEDAVAPFVRQVAMHANIFTQ
ncbi:Tuberous sclerosis 2-like protein, partial [Dispira parvispora]